jgi:acyl carrier protein
LPPDPGVWQPLPNIGRPISNARIYILSESRKPVPSGVTGEIYIGGPCVARGYVKRPELSAERFVEDPFSNRPGARMYRTGDLGRHTAEGEIDFQGRSDHQVKVRGYRIELGEIEAQLERYEHVGKAVVVACEIAEGEKRLAAYLVPRDDAQVDVDDLRRRLTETLPEYMVPGAFTVLQRLPVTPTGKLDRRALPPPSFVADGGRPREAPQGKIEEALAEIWREVLHAKEVDRRDNFFQIGGHSLLSMKLIVRVADRMKLRLPVSAVFQRPTIPQMAQLIEELLARSAAQPVTEEPDLQEGVI